MTFLHGNVCLQAAVLLRGRVVRLRSRAVSQSSYNLASMNSHELLPEACQVLQLANMPRGSHLVAMAYSSICFQPDAFRCIS